MTLTEKAAYLKGLAEGIALDASKPETKLINAMLDLIGELTEAVDRLEDITDELLDRFGEPPRPTQNLLWIALIHSLAVKSRVTSIRQDANEVHIYPQKLDFERWAEVSDAFPGKLRILMAGEMHLCLRLQKGDDVLPLIYKIFEKYLKNGNEKG